MLTRIFDYVIRPQDTLFAISLKFNVPLETLIQLNNISDPDMIIAGNVLKIPVTEEFYQIVQLVNGQCGNTLSKSETAVEVSAESEKVTETAVQATAEITDINCENCIIYKRHRVRRGDTVYLLAKEYNTTTGNILALNPQITDVRNIRIGSVITIPIPPKSAYIYVVRPGDTVFSIARAQGVTVESIMQYNYIEDDQLLYPGQQLVIVK